ncbi:hypothetical protein J5289_18140 [Rhizobium sp. B230/85]|uniref:P-loop NTPase fold protein n=1 Tax=unclassified Rhizobium TaxID=2613769 RepID=UPI001ADD3749|nr:MULTISPECIES: P-loop NTPase fold protein [unclassified Rhizobium]MBO9136559.1 hypothetical protein [Rhizobium sp. B209b/85]QXZ98529.1 hypothetical protein J5289_18140 [Rhizobium sp. B230/85]
MPDAKLVRKIIIDQPSPEDLFHGKGHDRTATALANTIREFVSVGDRAIGLDGPWGSGKSSVVGIAARKLREGRTKESARFHFFTFDIWKSEGAAFRRSFLEHFVAWALLNFAAKSQHLHKIEAKIHGKIRTVDTDNQQLLDWFGIAVLLLVPFLPVYVFWSKAVFDGLGVADKELFLHSWPMWVLYVVVFATLLWSAKKYGEMAKAGDFPDGAGTNQKIRSALSRTLLISSKQFERQTVTQRIRETDPNDFEFQSVLREILGVIQGTDDKVVVASTISTDFPPRRSRNTGHLQDLSFRELLRMEMAARIVISPRSCLMIAS